jgi:peroxiredoxin
VGCASGVGRKAPAFALTDRDGDEFSLDRYRGDWFSVLVFVPGRGGDVPERLARLSDAANQFWGLRAQLIAVHEADDGTDRPDEAPGQAAGSVPFPVLADDGSVATRYGVVRVGQCLQPAAFVIDRAGKIVWTGEEDAALDPTTITAALRDVAR